MVWANRFYLPAPSALVRLSAEYPDEISPDLNAGTSSGPCTIPGALHPAESRCRRDPPASALPAWSDSASDAWMRTVLSGSWTACSKHNPVRDSADGIVFARLLISSFEHPACRRLCSASRFTSAATSASTTPTARSTTACSTTNARCTDSSRCVPCSREFPASGRHIPSSHPLTKSTRPPAPWQTFLGALWWVICWDHRTHTKEQQRHVAETLGALPKARSPQRESVAHANVPLVVSAAPVARHLSVGKL